ncbi:3-ketoacyl-ACP reductase [Marinibacterium profundimaris]|uniref:Uncharacterized protein n=1 Tax=Marinibacterium profundimaris TaxID=1679460 RepID=A0A225NG29_9RHOB|nr:3-ketoacyl-ACP reductase [Marinibacterium profundimaris]OWU68998.1 hypothetical protein ATO3_23075 [Marinibacterium profundimaris]
MPSTTDLHDRLDKIAARLDAARQKMAFRRGLNDGHNLTSGELIARHRFLKETLDRDVAEIEVHDHHVSALERDVLAWINSIDLARS